MNKEEFFKQHPSLIDKIAVDNDGIGWIEVFDVHETQIDKKKVEEAIKKAEDYVDDNCLDQVPSSSQCLRDSSSFREYFEVYKRELKKELGL